LDASVKLLVVGSGELEQELKRLAESLKLSQRVIFAGEVAHAELPDYLHLASVFVRPSRSEGLGNAFLEAMAANVPIIGTAVGGIKDFLIDQQTGLACRVDNAYDLAEKIKQLQYNNQLRRRLADNAMKLVCERYDWSQSAASMKNIIESLV
jgi:glycosyltransferase involved in cell wall biosynthesis